MHTNSLNQIFESKRPTRRRSIQQMNQKKNEEVSGLRFVWIRRHISFFVVERWTNMHIWGSTIRLTLSPLSLFYFEHHHFLSMSITHIAYLLESLTWHKRDEEKNAGIRFFFFLLLLLRSLSFLRKKCRMAGKEKEKEEGREKNNNNQ